MVESGKKFNVVAISGGLRAASTNSALLQLAKELGKDVVEIEILDIKGVPLYDGDIEAAGIPEQVKTIAAKIASADGLYLATPEHNYSISAAMKNIIDWVTRVQPNPLAKKPIAIATAAAGGAGGARAQYDLRKILVFSGSHVLPTNEVQIGANYLKFSQTGELTDEAGKKAVGDQIKAFAEYITFVQKGYGL